MGFTARHTYLGHVVLVSSLMGDIDLKAQQEYKREVMADGCFPLLFESISLQGRFFSNFKLYYALKKSVKKYTSTIAHSLSFVINIWYFYCKNGAFI